MMNSELEQQLKQDGHALTEVAGRRLAKQDFTVAIMQQITEPTKPNKRLWPVGLAAAMALFSVAWLVQQQTPIMNPTPVVAQQTQELEFNLYQLPLQVETTLNQTLLEEQQAIIEDLKNLREQLLSI